MTKRNYYHRTALELQDTQKVEQIIQSAIKNINEDVEIVFHNMFTRDFIKINSNNNILSENLNIRELQLKSSQNFQYLDLIFDNILKLENIELQNYKKKRLFKFLLSRSNSYLESKQKFFNTMESSKKDINNPEKIAQIDEYLEIVNNNITILNEKKTYWSTYLPIDVYTEIMTKHALIIPDDQPPKVFKPLMDIRSLFGQQIDLEVKSPTLNLNTDINLKATEVDIVNYNKNILSSSATEIDNSLINVESNQNESKSNSSTDTDVAIDESDSSTDTDPEIEQYLEMKSTVLIPSSYENSFTFFDIILELISI